ncbi:hypothetical protein MPTK1_4g11990 [Marchantia polymorpha subsp. ruderalis]|uniref:Uncharacterized protein n=1 Tax=Marchantia polymorpha subsp. ruderalis TaxID=1480154 RepID=A0AAF6B904_MARPO|nr:hypothetical protein Mp_4g11990 [Marchantia polymorpha subsp. ruderalis]
MSRIACTRQPAISKLSSRNRRHLLRCYGNIDMEEAICIDRRRRVIKTANRSVNHQ